MSRIALSLVVLLLVHGSAFATTAKVIKDEQGVKLEVDGKDLLLKGINWGYSPIGHNYSYSLWAQPDDFIERVLRRDMGLLRAMGVNVIRQFPDIPPQWVAWIYEKYGIYTMMNHTMGRYGLTVDGVFTEKTDYSNPVHRRALSEEILGVVARYKGTPGLLMWTLGNENNYGLAWTGYEAENLPGAGQENVARAAALYSLYGDIIRAIKQADPTRPVAIANGDLQYVDLIAKYCKELDILGSNVYRGASMRDFYQVVHDKLGVPVMFTEFGADAYNARTGREDAPAQAEYLRKQWQEIYEQTWGKGRVGNAIGGFIFQWTDGWWKYKQEEFLDIHDVTASWANEAYPHDFVAGKNNMNEEWFGIAAIEDQGPDTFYEVQPRVAYYLLRAAFRLDAYAETTTLDEIRKHFDNLQAEDFTSEYESRRAVAGVASLGKVRVSSLRLRFETNTTSGSQHTARVDAPVFDHTESFFVDFTVQPMPSVSARLSLNVVGNAAQNRLDPLYWENRVKPTPPGTARAATDDATAELQALDHVAIYQAELRAEHDWVDLEGYYRVGHGHWGYEGDFFGLYREAYYGPAIDIYHANAPFGLVLSGKQTLSDFKLAFGTEVYWGANPTVIGKWAHKFGDVSVAITHQEDVAESSGARTSSAIYEPLSRRTGLYAAIPFGPAKLELGGLFSSPQRVGRSYTFTDETAPGMGYLSSGYNVYTGEVAWADTLGARAKLSVDQGVARWYVEGGYRGLVADAGGDHTITWTGWSMKPSGRGNQVNALAGVLLTFGTVQIAPNALWQRPIVGPNPIIADQLDPDTDMYFPGVKPRNVLEDPFAVIDNRETIGGELLLIYDPTPATWYWNWDRERREDAPFAASLDTVYRHQPTSRDATLIILADGSQVPAGATPPVHDVWQSTFSWSAAFPRRLRLSGTLYAGQDQASAGDPRLVTRGGASVRLIKDGFSAGSDLKLRDWGPYDYHRDFNLTFPLQWYGDVSYGLPRGALGAADTRIGLRWQLRFLDGFSEGYVPDPAAPKSMGAEAEALTYVLVSL